MKYFGNEQVHINSVAKRRKQIKIMAVKHMGGKCVKCGYSKYPEVLEFHHKNPSTKEFNLVLNGLTRSWERTRKEIEKCDLLCANCHREKHVEERKNRN